MQVVESAQQLGDQIDLARKLAGATRCPQGLRPWEQLHGEVRTELVVEAVVDDFDDVRVMERRQCLKLPRQAEAGVVSFCRASRGVLVTQDLECDDTAVQGVGGAVDRAHAAVTQLLVQQVAAIDDLGGLGQAHRAAALSCGLAAGAGVGINADQPRILDGHSVVKTLQHHQENGSDRRACSHLAATYVGEATGPDYS